MQNIKWQKLNYSEPYYFFVPKDFARENKSGFSLLDLFRFNSISIVFGDKENLLSFTKTDYLEDPVLICAFDNRYTKYGKDLQRARQNIMDHLYYNKGNIALLIAKQNKNTLAFVSKNIVSKHALTDSTYTFPLYLYMENESCIPNFKKEIVDEIEKIVGNVSPEDIFDYIYAVLHSPTYRERYKEFLKIDFPRVPYPKDAKSFKELVVLGSELRFLHLLESPNVHQFITTYPVVGSDTIEKIIYKDSNVFINKDQYFGNVPEVAWNFYIGGYQPAQKWLKDRKNRTLTNADIEHYQKMIVALTETEKIMKEIDKIASKFNFV
jgi:predicted helicase